MAASVALLIGAGALAILYFWIKHHFAYWRRKNVAYIEPNPIFGNFLDMYRMKSSTSQLMTRIYNHKNSQDQPIVGIYVFNQPALLIRDTELIKSILVKDFTKFCDRFASCDPHDDALGSHNLFFIKNPYWRELRKKVSPVFTSGKIRQMFSLLEEIGIELDTYLTSLPRDPTTNSFVIEVRNISALYATDVIASVAFGLRANSINNPNDDFRRNGKIIFDFKTFRAVEFSMLFFLPKLVSFLKCKLFPKTSAKFLRETVDYAMSERLKSGVTRNDMIDILVAFKKQAETDKSSPVTNDMMVAQSAAFFTAGFETVSSTMSFGMYELTKKPELQKRLRDEIKEALTKTGGRITYEMLEEMEYLHMVIQEVLRLYPPIPFLDRKCTLSKDETEYSLKPHSEFGVPNGMPVYVSVFALHRDPEYFPDPDNFDPERFSPENKSNLKSDAYMPFGAGPHNCIGMRIGMLQAKIGLISFLRNHYVTTCEKSHETMVLDSKAMTIQPKGGIYCKIVRDPLLCD